MISYRHTPVSYRANVLNDNCHIRHFRYTTKYKYSATTGWTSVTSSLAASTYYLYDISIPLKICLSYIYIALHKWDVDQLIVLKIRIDFHFNFYVFDELVIFQILYLPLIPGYSPG